MGEGPATVSCQLMQDGRELEKQEIPLSGNGQTARFIDELFAATDTSDFVGSVRCTESEGGLFTGVALEMGFPESDFHDAARGSRIPDGDAGLHATALRPFCQRGVHYLQPGARERS